MFRTPLRNVSYLPPDQVEYVTAEELISEKIPAAFMELDMKRKPAIAPEWTKVQPPIAPPVGPMLEDRVRNSYKMFKIHDARHAAQDAFYRAQRRGHYKRPIDKIRWSLHVKLIQWGVII